MQQRPCFYNSFDSYNSTSPTIDDLRSPQLIAAEFNEARARALDLRNELVSHPEIAAAIQAAADSFNLNNSDDVIQDATLALIEKVWRTSAAQRVEDWAKWTYHFVRNAILSRLRANTEQLIAPAPSYRRNGKPVFDLDDRDYIEPSPERQDQLKRSINRLPPAERQIMSLHIAGRSNAEIATELNKKPSTVRASLSRAKSRLAKSMEAA
jgi:RNA polymerase sigma factor (sigma-70 family)